MTFYHHTIENIQSQLLLHTTRLTNDDILIWADMISDEDLDSMIRTNGLPGIIISTAHDVPVLGECRVLHCPLYLWFFSHSMHQQANLYDDLPVLTCANFMINKKQINRYLLLKLVEWFDLSSYQYTWSGIGSSFDMTECLDDFDWLDNHDIADKFKTHLLSPVNKIRPCFKNRDGSVINTVNNHLSNIANYGSNIWTWNNFLGEMMSQSAVSLISESIRHEKRMIYTEKTVFATYALTFPLWIGGYKQAELWAKKGFDTFDDIINHDYQHCNSLLERCTRAFEDNLHILTDLEFAREQKIKNLHRLKKSRENTLQIFTDQFDRFWEAHGPTLTASAC